jgi:hypothetical protein
MRRPGQFGHLVLRFGQFGHLELRLGQFGHLILGLDSLVTLYWVWTVWPMCEEWTVWSPHDGTWTVWSPELCEVVKGYRNAIYKRIYF